MESKIRVVMIATNLGLNGISSVIMNYCRNIDLDQYKITIMAGGPIDDSYRAECNKLGIDIILLPYRKPTTKEYYKAMFKELSKNKFDIMHVHGNSSALTIELFFAWLKGIKVRIAHCHSITCTNVKMHKVLLPIFKLLYNKGLACSSIAGKWLFGENRYEVLPNGFEIEKFVFNSRYREEIRNQIKVKDDAFIIGSIGRFNGIKNQEFMLNVFEEIVKNNENVYMMFVGDGPNIKEFEDKMDKRAYKDKIIMYGETTETFKIYSAIDLFVFPSKYEGLGIVMIEAQINGLNCIASNMVPKEVDITNKVKFLPIGELDSTLWSEYILKYIRKKEARKNIDINNVNIQKYNIKNSVKLLESIYKERMQS